MNIPSFIYGTAWKEEKTEDLTLAALTAGFRAIDTANQRKHYHEEAVGEGLRRFLRQTQSPRESFFIQTKFTFARGQDHRKPYDDNSPIATQVQQSFARSLTHLKLDYLDSFILHGPYSNRGLAPEDWEAWREFEVLYMAKKIRHLGVSNVSFDQLAELFEGAIVKPTFVQNRCYARLGWDSRVREVCQKNGIFYQGFSLLTANPQVLSSEPLLRIAHKYGRTPAQIVFRFCRHLGIIPLTGTTDLRHMREDLESYDFELTVNEVGALESISLG